MNAPTTLPAFDVPPLHPDELRFEFSGSGGAYFKIWIVNLLLSILTLGIYSAWAKVRRERYFMGNTLLDGSAFDYHADPVRILKGRLLVMAAIVVANIAVEFNPLLNLAVMLLFAVLLPWMISRALRFRAHNTSWRGLRFGFDGLTWEAAKAWVLWPVAGVLSLGLLFPVALAKQRRYLFNHLRFGQAEFEIDLPVGPVYRVFGRVALFALAYVVMVVGLGGSLEMLSNREAVQGGAAFSFYFMATTLALYVGFALIAPYVSAHLANLSFNRANLQNHGFFSDMVPGRYVWIVLSNWLLTALTLGLFRPFAVVRLWRYRVEHLALLPAGTLTAFMAVQAEEARVIGEEAADLLDVDLGF
ncbi:YjgN family protein [Denitromonas sp.]|uniref:YjgN family protein n=1 Tax=Denitromonas sp. TaxID=2734609 RepID=UPI002AFFB8F8|nr:YjgN family protein [Denitromonas sp.]